MKRLSFGKADCEIVIDKNFNKAVNWFRVVPFFFCKINSFILFLQSLRFGHRFSIDSFELRWRWRNHLQVQRENLPTTLDNLSRQESWLLKRCRDYLFVTSFLFSEERKALEAVTLLEPKLTTTIEVVAVQNNCPFVVEKWQTTCTCVTS